MTADRISVKCVTFKEYLSYMKNDRSWGDGIMINVAELLYERPIQVLSASNKILKRGALISDQHEIATRNKNKMILGLRGFTSGSTSQMDHYVSLLPLNSKLLSNLTN